MGKELEFKEGFYCWNCNGYLGAYEFECESCHTHTHSPLYLQQASVPLQLRCASHEDGIEDLYKVRRGYAFYLCQVTRHRDRYRLSIFSPKRREKLRGAV